MTGYTFFFDKAGEDDDFARWTSFTNAPGRFHTANALHDQIHEHDIRSQLYRHPHSFFSAARFCHHLDIILG